MSDEPQNPISEENSIPASPQEPVADAPILPMDSDPTNAPSEALESSPNDFSVKSNDMPPSNSIPTEVVNEPKAEEKQAENEPSTEPISEPFQAIEPSTAQIPPNEPIGELVKPELEPEKIIPVPEIVSNKNKILELLAKAKNAIQFRKRKKLDRVMALFLKKSKITNDEVEKFIHVSDATATRYLSQLEKEGKIKKSGKTGHAVSYSRI